MPYVLADGYTINLTLIPSLTEFNGYGIVPNIANVTGGLNVVQLPVILPQFTVRQVITTVNVWDGQTVVLGGLITSTTQTETAVSYGSIYIIPVYCAQESKAIMHSRSVTS